MTPTRQQLTAARDAAEHEACAEAVNSGAILFMEKRIILFAACILDDVRLERSPDLNPESMPVDMRESYVQAAVLIDRAAGYAR